MARHAKPITAYAGLVRFVDRHNLHALKVRLASRKPKHAGGYNAERDIVPAYMLNEAGYFVHHNTRWDQTIVVGTRMNETPRDEAKRKLNKRYGRFSAEALGLDPVSSVTEFNPPILF